MKGLSLVSILFVLAFFVSGTVASEDLDQEEWFDVEEITEQDAKEETSEEDSEDKDELKKELSEMKDKLLKKECAEVVGKALSDGKILPKDKKVFEEQYMTNPEGTAKMLSALPKAVKLGEKGISSDEGEEDMSELKIMKEAKALHDKYKTQGNKDIKLSDCIIEVRQNNPELGKEWETNTIENGNHPKRVQRF